MFKKNKALSIVGLTSTIAITALDWSGAAALDCLGVVKLLQFVIAGALFGAAITLLVQALRNGTYGE